MTTAEIKNDLHRMVVETDNIEVLHKIKSIFNTLLKGNQDVDWWDFINEDEKTSIQKGLQQLENGERVAHLDVRKEIDLLLKK